MSMALAVTTPVQRGTKVLYHDVVAEVVRFGLKHTRVLLLDRNETALVPTDSLEVLPEVEQWVTDFKQLQRRSSKVVSRSHQVNGAIWRPETGNNLRLRLKGEEAAEYSPGHIRMPSKLTRNQLYHAFRVAQPGSGTAVEEKDFVELKAAQQWVEQAVKWVPTP